MIIEFREKLVFVIISYESHCAMMQFIRNKVLLVIGDEEDASLLAWYSYRRGSRTGWEVAPLLLGLLHMESVRYNNVWEGIFLSKKKKMFQEEFSGVSLRKVCCNLYTWMIEVSVDGKQSFLQLVGNIWYNFFW